jgi:type IV pilus assembly protein PilB
MNELEIRDLLLKQDYVDEEDMRRAEVAAKAKGISALEELIEEELLSESVIGQAIAESFAAPFADLRAFMPSKELLLRIPEVEARRLRTVFFWEDNSTVIVATDNPMQREIHAVVDSFAPKRAVIAYALPDQLDAALNGYPHSLDTAFRKILSEATRVAPEMLDKVIEEAIRLRASDIHLEPEEEAVGIRFRIDGVLHEAGSFKKEFYENILNRIKIEANLRIDEHLSAQDGAARFGKSRIDLRISVIPTLNGEKVAIRILARSGDASRMDQLGLTGRSKSAVQSFLKKPFGMIIVSGPTGSGKSTTLYTLLQTLNRPETNIMTIEDPVEYKIPGVTQIQVNQTTNLTFAEGLRSIVRQDPNIILVGEIRDKETAEIAVNASLTGHLMLSTFHATDAAMTIPRLLEMNIEPFLLSSTLELIVSQRLVRRLCEACRYTVPADEETLGPDLMRSLQITPGTALFKSRGCTSCNNIGFKGRIAVFEVVPLDKELRELILTYPSAEKIREAIQRGGHKTMFEDGMEKVLKGVTTFEELIRVVPRLETLQHA